MNEPNLHFVFTVPLKMRHLPKKLLLARQTLFLDTSLGSGFLIDAQTRDHKEKRKRSHGSEREKRKRKKKRAPSPPCCFSPVCSSHFSKESVSIYYYYQPECRQTFTTCCSGSRRLPSFLTRASSFDGSTCCKGHHRHLFSLALCSEHCSLACSIFHVRKKAFPLSSPQFPLSVAGRQAEVGEVPSPHGPLQPNPVHSGIHRGLRRGHWGAGRGCTSPTPSSFLFPPFIPFLLMFFIFVHTTQSSDTHKLLVT